MVNLLTGPKGSGKTQQMIEQANKQAKECKGNVVFIKKTHRDTASVAFDIRTICMDDFPSITNTDEYIGFLYGMYSSNHRLKKLSEECGINFYVSISAEKAELKDINLDGCTLLN